jgi:Spy/CpxP family protein refolding chaperone
VFTTLKMCVLCTLMKITTLIYCVLISTLCGPWNGALAQTAASTAEPTASLPVAPPAKRVVNPESIKRAKLTRLRKDVALTDEQTTKVKPLIDAYVNDMQAVKNDASLDSRTKRQKLSEVRHKYDTDLDGVLNPEQQQKLASIKEERRARLRAARTATSGPLEPSASPGLPAVVQ